MSMQLDAKLKVEGTRFRLFAQSRYLKSFSEPEIVYVSLPPGAVKAGPEDERMFVIDAIGKKPYDRFGPQPQWDGRRHPPVEPDASGHFDYVDINSREFSCTTMYATVRRVLDIWEDYFKRPIEWAFQMYFERLELIPSIEWDNAQSGFGFLEFGFGRLPNGGIDHQSPYCQNFDVLAHELGHSIIFSEVGTPDTEASATDEYGGFHESCGDLVAIVASLHFDSVVNHILKHSSGNLFTVNELDRLGELPDGREIRVAFNYERMSTVSAEPHDLSLPLTGAIFDIFVGRYQAELVARGLITLDLALRSTHGQAPNSALPQIQAEFDQAYKGHEEGFKEALLSARDYLGRLLATAWDGLSANYLSYYKVGLALLKADRRLTGGANRDNIRANFAWREISLAHPVHLMRRLSETGMISARRPYANPFMPEAVEHCSLAHRPLRDSSAM